MLHRLAFVLGSVVFSMITIPTLAAESQWVFPGEAGRLLHQSRASGDRVPNFASVGYRGGTETIPHIGTQISVSPTGGDDTNAIQSAINFVSSLPLDANGFRGAVELTSGEFLIRSSIDIRRSGVVLRGAGDSDAGTVLRALGTSQRSLVNIETGGSRLKNTSSDRSILDKYVPVGATSFTVADAATFSVGDDIVVFRPSTANWISDLGMDMIPPRSDGGTVTQWTAGSRDLHSERKIVRVEGNRVFVDAPITNSLDQQYGGGTIYKYVHSNRIENVGIENLKGQSDYDLSNPFDEDHSWTFISVDDVDHAWVKGVTSQHFARNTVSIERDAKHVTVVDSHSLDPISVITGSRRYAFEVDGQLNIVRDSTSDQGRHDFILNSPSPGPNVFLDNTATNSLNDTGPHQRWSTGGLFDNVSVDGDQINIRNRGNFGTGHGWAGANMVVWNSTADEFIVQNPPTAQNWLIGSVGTIVNETRFGQQEDGLYDQHGQNVETRSLYLQQLADRMAIEGSEFREYVTGDYDGFVNDGAVDSPFVSSQLQDAFSSILTDPNLAVVGFDETQVNNAIPFSWQFSLDSNEQVAHAVVSLSLRKAGGSTVDDSIFFESLSNELQFASDLGLTTELSTTDATVVLLEFSSLDEIALFNDGEFNLLITDDVAVDWARLELTVGSGARADFDVDGDVDAADIDLLCGQLGGMETEYDLNGDGAVDHLDFDQMILSEIGTLFGDINLDGVVDISDFNLWNANKFTSGGWAHGDGNCDGVVDISDFNIWNANKFQAADSVVVPEPAGTTCCLLTLLIMVHFCRRDLFALDHRSA